MIIVFFFFATKIKGEYQKNDINACFFYKSDFRRVGKLIRNQKSDDFNIFKRGRVSMTDD